MALDLQIIPLHADFVPYERPPQHLTLWSAIPRGLLTMFNQFRVLDPKALNDEMLLSFTGILPPSFGYVMADCNVSIAQDEASDWNSIVNLNLQNFYRLNSVTESLALDGNWVQEFPVNSVLGAGRAISVINPWPAYPIIGTARTSGIQISLSISNPGTAATTGGATSAFISFWEFDLEQIRKFPINTPIPVQAR